MFVSGISTGNVYQSIWANSFGLTQTFTAGGLGVYVLEITRPPPPGENRGKCTIKSGRERGNRKEKGRQMKDEGKIEVNRVPNINTK